MRGEAEGVRGEMSGGASVIGRGEKTTGETEPRLRQRTRTERMRGEGSFRKEETGQGTKIEGEGRVGQEMGCCTARS